MNESIVSMKNEADGENNILDINRSPFNLTILDDDSIEGPEGDSKGNPFGPFRLTAREAELCRQVDRDIARYKATHPYGMGLDADLLAELQPYLTDNCDHERKSPRQWNQCITNNYNKKKGQTIPTISAFDPDDPTYADMIERFKRHLSDTQSHGIIDSHVE
ncbi:hypothetical protein RDWZM_003252 [Blomia tropicalis]|uniref:Uncharacterized protein n=1 Tax=Blomia tropicalis TaxID=40697 RepID=A0A9Q0MFH7_BLOTA|nr:hypothetical protein RDWZM_003252 [Blomia tropicalis]